MPQPLSLTGAPQVFCISSILLFQPCSSRFWSRSSCMLGVVPFPRTKNLGCKAQVSPIIQRAHTPERPLDAFRIVPSDIRIHLAHELFDGGPGPVAPVEHLVFEPAEETFACRVIRAAAFLGHRAHKPRLVNRQPLFRQDSQRPSPEINRAQVA